MSVKGRTVIVTGSNSGIGLGIAREMARAGADVVLNSFTDREEDHALARGLSEEFGVDARYVKADMSRPEDCRALVEQAPACDILVNNAGIQHVAPIPEFPTEKWDAIIAINLSSAFHTTAAALPRMRAAGWGRVINIASAHGLRASPFKSAYVTAKHGIVGHDQGGGPRNRDGSDHLQRHLPRVRADPARRGADPRYREGIRHL